jgi:hypothetical protein
MGHAHHRPRFTRGDIALRDFWRARITWFGSGHKPKFTGYCHCTGGIFADVMEFACLRDHIVGRRPHRGSSEPPEAYAENILGVSR